MSTLPRINPSQKKPLEERLRLLKDRVIADRKTLTERKKAFFKRYQDIYEELRFLESEITELFNYPLGREDKMPRVQGGIVLLDCEIIDYLQTPFKYKRAKMIELMRKYGCGKNRILQLIRLSGMKDKLERPEPEPEILSSSLDMRKYDI